MTEEKTFFQAEETIDKSIQRLQADSSNSENSVTVGSKNNIGITIEYSLQNISTNDKSAYEPNVSNPVHHKTSTTSRDFLIEPGDDDNGLDSILQTATDSEYSITNAGMYFVSGS